MFSKSATWRSWAPLETPIARFSGAIRVIPMISDRRQFLAASAFLTLPAFLHAADEAKGLVIGQAESAAAGNAMLAGGGNAVDAVVTAALVAGAVALPSAGIGGYGGHLVLARPDGKV